MPAELPDVDLLRPQDGFRFCPRCAAPSPNVAGRRVVCGACGFCLYLNTTVSATGFLRNERGETLFIRRAKDPAKGKLAAPGGFIDPGEPAEDALRREMREEVGIEIQNIRFLCSFPNDYPYRGVVYSVCDLFFVADAASELGQIEAREVADALWLPANSVSADDLAFVSMRRAFVVYQSQDIPKKGSETIGQDWNLDFRPEAYGIEDEEDDETELVKFAFSDSGTPNSQSQELVVRWKDGAYEYVFRGYDDDIVIDMKERELPVDVPLTFGQLLRLIDALENIAGYQGHIVTGGLSWEFISNSDQAHAAAGSTSTSSDHYPELSAYFDREIEESLRHCLESLEEENDNDDEEETDVTGDSLLDDSQNPTEQNNLA